MGSEKIVPVLLVLLIVILGIIAYGIFKLGPTEAGEGTEAATELDKAEEPASGVRAKGEGNDATREPDVAQANGGESNAVQEPEGTVFYAQACGAGEAIRSFDLLSSDEPVCVPIESTTQVISTPQAGDGEEQVHHDHFTLMVNGDSDTETTIRDGDTIDLLEGEGIEVSKSGNSITISALAQEASTEPPASGSTGMTDWRVAGEGSVEQFTVGDGEKVGFVGEGATSVTFSTAKQKIIITSPEAKVFQYRYVQAHCSSSGSILSQSPGITVSRCSSAELIVQCSEGEILSYGGGCGSSEISYLYPTDTSYSSWIDDLPSLSDVALGCSSATSKTIRLTCVREKP